MRKKSSTKKTNRKKIQNNNLLLFPVLFLERLGNLSYTFPRIIFKFLNVHGVSFLAFAKKQFEEFLENSRLLFSILFSFGRRILIKSLSKTFSFSVFEKPKKKSHKKRGRPKKERTLSEELKKHNILYRFLINRYSLSLGLLTLFIVFFFYSYMLVTAARNLPSPEKLSESNGPLTTEIYDRNGKLLYRLYEGKNRSLSKLNELPPYLVQATIAIEDKHFYSHPGVDIQGITRAAVDYVQSGEIQGGGSTITQQLIKNTLLTPEQTVKRKIKEVVLAFWAERIFSKEEILQMYFNEVAYGGPAWGISAAAQTYFSKDPKDLTLAESTYLAGLPASPTTYSPYGVYPELGKMRQQQVLRRMVEDGFISEEQASAALQEELKINPPISQINAPHFVMYVRQVLSQKYGERMVSQGGLKVTTTLDLGIQEMAEQVVSQEVANLTSLNVSNGAAMVTDAKTGHILAMVGSRDYFDPNGGNFNVAIALRQPGSSIKPITYVTGFKQGFTPGNLLLDTPITFRNAWESYAPVNYDGKFHGPVTIRTALGSSYNIPAVKMLSMVGIPEMISTAKDLGINSFNKPERYGLSLTLGGGEVKMVEMMAAYGTFSQEGVRFTSEPILKVLDSQNKVLEDNTIPEGKRVLSPEIAYMVTDVMADNKARTPAFGSNSLLNIPGHIVAVKTGTTDNKRDNWTFGYTPEFVVGVWVGNNNNMPMHPQLTSGITGAAPIWHKIMSGVLKDRPNVAFSRPSTVIEGTVDGKRDLVVAGQKTKSILGFRNQPDPTDPSGNKQNITYTDPFSTITLDPNNPNAQPITQ
jgi:1A family penicillin-binding protein